jgi:hypothetical protein
LVLRRLRSLAFTLIPCVTQPRTRFQRAHQSESFPKYKSGFAKALFGVKLAAYKTECEISGLASPIPKFVHCVPSSAAALMMARLDIQRQASKLAGSRKRYLSKVREAAKSAWRMAP